MCRGFIFCPSGHVLGLLLLSFELKLTGHAWAAQFCHLVNGAQMLRLIALQGHYTVDIIVALLLALVVDPRVEDALDSESPKEALVELLLLATQPDAAEARSLDLSLRQELAPLKLGALQVNAPRPPPSLLTCSFMWLSNRGLACRRHGRSLPVQTRPQWTRLWMPTTGRRSSRSSSSELSLISPSQ